MRAVVSLDQRHAPTGGGDPRPQVRTVRLFSYGKNREEMTREWGCALSRHPGASGGELEADGEASRGGRVRGAGKRRPLARGSDAAAFILLGRNRTRSLGNGALSRCAELAEGR